MGRRSGNRDHLMQGHQDSPLTELGKQQVLALRGKFRDIKFDRVLSSDLPRAISTARLIIGDSPIEFVTTPALRERNYGPFEEVDKNIYLQAIKQNLGKLPPGVETTSELQSRILGCLTWAAWNWAGDTMLVTSHGSGIKYSLIKLGFEELNDPGLILVNGSYFKVVHDGKKFRVDRHTL